MQSLRLRKTPRHPLLIHRSFHVSTCLLRPSRASDPPASSHSAESYSKDVDETPPDDPTIHRVDAASEAAQRPYEPPSGQWSRAGVKTSEYSEHSIDEDNPYGALNEAKGKKLREGPEGEAKGGRKPERSPSS